MNRSIIRATIRRVFAVLALCTVTWGANINVTSVKPFTPFGIGTDLSGDFRAADRFTIRTDFGWSNVDSFVSYRIMLDGVTVHSSFMPMSGTGFVSLQSGTLIATQGIHVLAAQVDDLNQVSETDEADNYLAYTVTVTEASAPLIVDFVADASTVSASVSNLTIGVTNSLYGGTNLVNDLAWAQGQSLVTYTRQTVLVITNIGDSFFLRAASDR